MSQKKPNRLLHYPGTKKPEAAPPEDSVSAFRGRSPEVPLSIKRASVKVYDQVFSFDPPGEKTYESSRKLAVEKAKAYGREYQAKLATDAGRPITLREQLSGKLEQPKVDTGPTLRPKPGENNVRNPYSIALESERSRFAPTLQDKQRQAARVARLEALYNERESELLKAEAETQHSLSPEVKRVRDFVASLEQSLRKEPLSAAQKAELAQIRSFCNQPMFDHAQAWQRLTAAGFINTERRAPVGVETDVTGKLAAGQYIANTTGPDGDRNA